MPTLFSKILFYLGGFAAALLMMFNTGCASGGFKLTRQYAGFVNRQNLILRIVIYLFTGIVFAITMLIDVVVFNTMDFWQGRVSQGTYEFKQDGKTFQARHEILPGTNLKQSTINVIAANGERVQEVIVRETTSGQVEFLVDGVLRTKVDSINDIPIASIYNAKGVWVSNEMILEEQAVAAR